MNQLITGPSIGFELISSNAVEKLKLCLSQSPEVRNEKNIDSLVALFEKEEIRNGIFCSQSSEDAAQVRVASVMRPLQKSAFCCFIQPQI